MPTPVITFTVVRFPRVDGWSVHSRNFAGGIHPTRRDALEEAYQWKDKTHPTARVRVTGDR